MRTRTAVRFAMVTGAIMMAPACARAAETVAESKVSSNPSAIPSDAPWARVLDGFWSDGGLDYAGLRASPDDLHGYLESLASARPAEAGQKERIAFWSNAYNAVTAGFVLERYPKIESVKAVDGFFDSLHFPVAGEELTLDEIETRARDEGDPRLHFAVVCASTSCPDLRSEPYRGSDLDRQLAEQTRGFLADPSKGLRFDGEELWLSSIFKWYAGDFTGGSTVVAFFARGKVVDWVLPHLPEALAGRIRAADPSVKYLDYDWSLNDR
ncbi:MAG: DUF547 domain-containing protein [Thermoanaerobaculia bacterium]